MEDLTLNDRLTSQIEYLLTSTFKEDDDTLEISSVDMSPLPDLCQTAFSFKQHLPNFDKIFQCDDINSTIDITLGNISFLNASILVSNEKDYCRNLLTIDDPSNLPHLEITQQNLDVKSIARCLDLNNKKMFQKYTEKKVKRKVVRLNHLLNCSDTRNEMDKECF